mgnify:CR=1 FL=1
MKVDLSEWSASSWDYILAFTDEERELSRSMTASVTVGDCTCHASCRCPGEIVDEA